MLTGHLQSENLIATIQKSICVSVEQVQAEEGAGAEAGCPEGRRGKWPGRRRASARVLPPSPAKVGRCQSRGAREHRPRDEDPEGEGLVKGGKPGAAPPGGVRRRVVEFRALPGVWETPIPMETSEAGRRHAGVALCLAGSRGPQRLLPRAAPAAVCDFVTCHGGGRRPKRKWHSAAERHEEQSAAGRERGKRREKTERAGRGRAYSAMHSGHL